jgi:transposase
MKFSNVIGIDVSKSVIDCCIYPVMEFYSFENSSNGYRKLLTWVAKTTKVSTDQLFFCFEHTGLYSSVLARFLSSKKLSFTIISGLEIKRSMGIQRGKNDQLDAKQIALYAYRRKEELTVFDMPDESIIRIKQLLSLREKLVKQRAGYQATMKEQRQFLKKSENPLLFSIPAKLILELDKQIKKIENQLDTIIAENQKLSELYDLVTSVPGVGKQTALYLLVVTNGFLFFKNARKLASYAGIAPFPYQSGSSIKGRTKVSPLANKKIKSLLSSCAISAIQHDPEIRLYYNRKLEDGKPKMSVINAVRNKVLLRIFAVVNRGMPYVNTHAYAE